MFRDPLRAVPAAVTMFYQPVQMGILPIFIWSMLLLPGFDALQRRFGDAALAAPIGVYLLVRLTGLAAPSLGPDTGIAFNPFAWQLVYLLGAWIGRRRLLRGRALPMLDRWSPLVTMAAVGMLVFGLVARLQWEGYTAWPVLDPTFWVGKEDLAPARLLHGLALAWLVARFVPVDAPWMHGRVGLVLAAIGRHSLQVFCVGLFLAWGVTAAFRLWPWAQGWLDPVLIAVGAAVLAAVGWRLDAPIRKRLRTPAVARVVSP